MAASDAKHEAAFVRAVERLTRRFTRDAVASFERHHLVVTAAARDDYVPPSWRFPLEGELLDQAAAQAELEATAKKYRDKAATTASHSMAAQLGIEFDQSNRLLQGVIASQSGMHIVTAPADLVRVMMDSLQESYDAGHSIPKAAREMRKAGYTRSRYDGERIARTELIRAVNSASLAQVRGATTIPYKLWMATNDARTRPHHREADGQTVPVDAAFSVGGFPLHFPGDPSGPGEEVIMCRCTMGYTDDSGFGVTKPMRGSSQDWSSVVDWHDDSEAATVMQDSLAIASRVHGTGPGTPPRVAFNGKPRSTAPTGERGAFLPRPGSTSVILLDVEGNKNAMTDALHEFGHYLDFEVLGSRGTFASHRPGGALRDVMRAINESRAVKYNIPQIGDPQTRKYLNLSHEKLARAYSQWITEASADPRLLAMPAYRRAQEKGGAQLWRSDDFKAIREAFDALAAEQKWHPVLTTTAGGSMAAVDTTTEDTAIGASWSGVIAQEGVDTGDGRRIAEGALNWRELPLTLMAQHTTPDFGGHAEAAVAGRIDTLTRNASDILGAGIFDTGEWGAETQRMVNEGMLKGVSIDLAINDAEIIPAEGVADEIEAMFLGTLNVLDGTILGATIVPFPAFENATIAIIAGAAMRLGQFRKNEDGDTVASFYMPFAPAPPAETPPVADDESDPGDAASDAAEAIADIKEVVDSWPGLNGDVVVTIDGQATTLDFPPANADGSEPGEDQSGSATISPAVMAALANLRTAMRKEAK